MFFLDKKIVTNNNFIFSDLIHKVNQDIMKKIYNTKKSKIIKTYRAKFVMNYKFPFLWTPSNAGKKDFSLQSLTITIYFECIHNVYCGENWNKQCQSGFMNTLALEISVRKITFFYKFNSVSFSIHCNIKKTSLYMQSFENLFILRYIKEFCINL